MKKRITIRSAKNKGMRLQKWVCEKIAVLLDIPFDNQNDNCLIHSRECGLSGTDIILRGVARELFPFDVECKATEQFNVYKDIEQAKKNALYKRPWLLIHRKNRSKAIVILDAEIFFDLLRKTL